MVALSDQVEQPSRTPRLSSPGTMAVRRLPNCGQELSTLPSYRDVVRLHARECRPTTFVDEGLPLPRVDLVEFSHIQGSFRGSAKFLGTATSSVVVSLTAICRAVLSSVHPPQLNPLNAVMRAPQAAPCMRRLGDSPLRNAGHSMNFPFARHSSERDSGRPAEVRLASWRGGPAALSWRFGHPMVRPFHAEVDDNVEGLTRLQAAVCLREKQRKRMPFQLTGRQES